MRKEGELTGGPICGLSTQHCGPVLVAQKVCARHRVTTNQIDKLSTETPRPPAPGAAPAASASKVRAAASVAAGGWAACRSHRASSGTDHLVGRLSCIDHLYLAAPPSVLVLDHTIVALRYDTSARHYHLSISGSRPYQVLRQFPAICPTPPMVPKRCSTKYSSRDLCLSEVLVIQWCPLSKLDFGDAYYRPWGSNIVLRFGFHCTGLPIMASTDELATEIQQYGNPPVFPAVEDGVSSEVADNQVYQAVAVAPDKFKRKKAKPAAKTGVQKFQWEILWGFGLSDEDIAKFQDLFAKANCIFVVAVFLPLSPPLLVWPQFVGMVTLAWIQDRGCAFPLSSVFGIPFPLHSCITNRSKRLQTAFLIQSTSNEKLMCNDD